MLTAVLSFLILRMFSKMKARNDDMSPTLKINGYMYDAFIVLLLVQVLSLLSPKFWLLYLLV